MVNLLSLSGGLFAIASYFSISTLAAPIPTIQYNAQSTNSPNSSLHLERRATARCADEVVSDAFRRGKSDEPTKFLLLGSLKLGGCTYYTTILDSQSKPHYWVVQQLPEGVTDVPDTWKTVITPEIKKTDDPKSPDVKTKVNQLGHVYDPRQDPHRYGYGFGGEVVDIVPPESITHLTALEDWMRRLPTLTPLLARTSDKEKPVEQKKSTLVTSDPGVAEKQKVAEQPTREATTGTSAAMPPRGRASSADSAPPKVAKPAETAHPTGDPKRLSWDSFSAKFNRALFGPSATDKTEGVKPLEFSFGVSEESFVPH